MAAELETGEGVVFKSESYGILLKDWKSYLKYGNDYDSYKPDVGQKVRAHFRPWTNPTTSKVSYYLNEIEVLGPPPEAQPSPAGPGPAVTYQATHDAAQGRVAVAGESPPPAPHGTDGYVETPIPGPEPKPGDYAFRDLSIQRQNRLNVTVQALVANLENCPPEEKINRMITPWLIAEFERMLVEGAVYDDGTGPDYQPPPEDLPGG